MAEKALNLQQQIRENAQELGDFLNDLNKWEDEIKQKDDDLKKSAKIDEVCLAFRFQTFLLFVSHCLF